MNLMRILPFDSDPHKSKAKLARFVAVTHAGA